MNGDTATFTTPLLSNIEIDNLEGLWKSPTVMVTYYPKFIQEKKCWPINFWV